MCVAPLFPLSPAEHIHLDQMFGNDPLLQGEILALFVADSHKCLAELADALVRGHAAPARLLAQQLLDHSTAMGLTQMRALAREAVNAGFANDFAEQRRLYAALRQALDAVSNAATRLSFLALAPVHARAPQILCIGSGIQDKCH